MRDKTKRQSFKEPREELFNPKDPSSTDTDFSMEEIGVIVSEILAQNLTDKKRLLEIMCKFKVARCIGPKIIQKRSKQG